MKVEDIREESTRWLVSRELMEIDKIRLQRAYVRTASMRRNTPLIKIPFLKERWGADVYMKCDQLQAIGAFKIRGAANFAMQLSPEELKNGLVTHSSGNHAQAVACLANKLGTKAFVVMPENANRHKMGLVRKWGAEITLCEPTVEARIATSNAIAEEHGAVIIPPFDHEWIVEGQATSAMEIFGKKDDFDYMVAPLGGGGLLAGSALAAHYFSKGTKVLGSEPEQAADGYRGFVSGIRETTSTANTIADGLRTLVGEVPFGYIRKHVEEVLLAPEAHIIPWMYKIWQETKMVIEPSCAVPFAALDQYRDKWKGKSLAIIVTGGNIDLSQLPPFAPLK